MISVIVPVYGVEKYIERCARSIFEQTYKDVEYIFVNDCTTDRSIHILREVVKNYSACNVTIINKEKNEGLPQARKTGLLASHGEYIIHFDSDDWVEPDCIEKMYASALNDNADIVISNYFENYENRQLLIQCPKAKNASEAINMMLRAQFHSGVWNKLVRREMYNGVVFPIANMHEDLVLMTQIFANAKRISNIEAAFYHYNLNNTTSLTTKSLDFEKVEATYNNLKEIEVFLVGRNMADNMLAFSNFVNTFKGAMMLSEQTRRVDWLGNLYGSSRNYIFSECRLALWKKILLWAAFHGVIFPYKVIDILRRMSL